MALLAMILAGASEGFGLALFVPIIEIMNGDSADAGGPASWIINGIDAIGLPRSVPLLLTGAVFMIISGFALTYLQVYLLARAKNYFVNRLRQRLFCALFKSEWHHLSAQVHGDVVNNILVESMRYGHSLVSEIKALALIAMIVIYLVIGALLSLEMTITVLFLGSFVVLVISPLIKRAKILGVRTHESNRDFGVLLVEALRGAKLIRVTASEDEVGRRFQKINDDLCHHVFASENNSEFIHFLAQALPVIALGLTMGVAYVNFDVRASVIVVFLMIVARLAPRLTQLQQTYDQYVLRSPTMPSIDRMIEKAEESSEELTMGLHPFTQLKTDIVFESASFRFPNASENALNDIDLRIGRREMVALVGSSGAGKSTLVDMLAGLRRPTSGRIRIDGQDFLDIDIYSWRRRIGYVTQDITLFNDTLRNNLSFVYPEAKDAELWNALRMAHLDDVVRSMADGLDTLLGENGVRLSGGQRQRLALARALVGSPEILLLDEATSALDSEAEQAIQAAIDDIAKQLTVLIVSHRLSTVRNADRIYVIEDGEIVESGTYGALVGSGGRFSQLHQLQTA